MKRFLDTALVLLASPLWVPAYALSALAIRVAMGSPVHFCQERAGLGGRPFRMLKLRTMRACSLSDAGSLSDAERTTRLGRVLRAASLDEIPQLLHVLSGKMSLVGPRPLPVRYLPRYSPGQARRHEVRPGITGWAQINGRNAISWEDKFALDVWYVDHQSLALDMKVLLLTFAKVLKRDGINASSSNTMEEFLGDQGRARSRTSR